MKIHNDEKFYGCYVCKFGYKGLVRNWEIPNCKVYTDYVDYDTGRTCSICKNGFELVQNGYVC